MEIKFCNLFLFILPFYKVKMVYLFARVTKVVPVYKFGGIFFLFNWTWFCYRLSHIVKYNSFRKKKNIIHKAKTCGESTVPFLTCYCGLLRYFPFFSFLFFSFFCPKIMLQCFQHCFFSLYFCFFFVIFFFSKIASVDFIFLILSWLRI